MWGAVRATSRFERPAIRRNSRNNVTARISRPGRDARVVELHVREVGPDVTVRASRPATEDIETPSCGGRKRGGIPAFISVERRIAGSQSPHEAGEAACDVGRRQPVRIDRAKRRSVRRIRHEPGLQLIEGKMHLQRVRDGLEHLAFE
jgi:hypothetical protein